MTDNDIIKALECCSAPICNCKECPMEGVNNCYTKLKYKTLDLINRLQADKNGLINGQETLQNYIEKQQAEIERYKGVIKLLENDVAEAKSEAVKEFAERLKEKTTYITSHLGNVSVLAQHKLIDNLVKEMTEQSVNYGSSKTEQ